MGFSISRVGGWVEGRQAGELSVGESESWGAQGLELPCNDSIGPFKLGPVLGSIVVELSDRLVTLIYITVR